MRFASLAVCLALFAFAAPAQAQDTDADVRASLAERLIDVIARANLEKVMGDMIEQQATTLSGMTDEQRAWYGENALPILLPHLQALIDDMEAGYADRFTATELRMLIAFYDTPEGRIISEKQNQAGAELGAQVGAMTTAYVTDLLQKFCAKFECPARGADTAQMKGH